MSDIRTLFAAVLLMLAPIAMLAVVALVTAISGPSCPTEDSCVPVYEHGQWTVIETTP